MKLKNIALVGLLWMSSCAVGNLHSSSTINYMNYSVKITFSDSCALGIDPKRIQQDIKNGLIVDPVIPQIKQIQVVYNGC